MDGCVIKYSFPSLSVELEEYGGAGIITFKVEPLTQVKQAEMKSKDQNDLFDAGGYFDLASIGLYSMTINCV